MEFRCDLCEKTKDEMLFLRRSRLLNCKPPRVCRMCSERASRVHHAETNYLKRTVGFQRGELMKILNTTMPFVDVKSRIRICEWALTKRWTIETVMGLHKLPMPILFAKIAAMQYQRGTNESHRKAEEREANFQG